MTARGAQLEDQFLRGARQYRRAGRCFLMKQQVKVVTTRKGEAQRTERAPIDFIGWIKAADCDIPAAYECKSHAGQSLPLREFGYGIDFDDKAQYAALDAFDVGGSAFAVISLYDVGEIYLVPWVAIAGFAAATTRKSLSLTFLRAHGQICRLDDDRLLFLDGQAHPDSERCLLDTWADRKNPIVSLDPADLESDPEPKPSEFAGLTKDQIRARLEEAAFEGGLNAAKKEKRKWRAAR